MTQCLLLQTEYPDLDQVDVEGDVFAALPAEMQHEMLRQMIEKRRENSWAKMDTLPEVSSALHHSSC